MGTCFGVGGVRSLPRQGKYSRVATKQIVIANVPWDAGELSRFEGASPTITDQDIAACDTKTGGTSPGEYAITFNVDGTYSFDSNGNTARQTFSVDVYSRRIRNWLGDTLGYVNNQAFQWQEDDFGPFVFKVGLNGADILLTGYGSDPEADSQSFSIAGANPSQPAWLTISSDSLVIGTPATENDVLITVRATDTPGDFSEAIFRLVSVDTITVPNFIGTSISGAVVTAQEIFLTPTSIGSGNVAFQSLTPGFEAEPFAAITLSDVVVSPAGAEIEEGQGLRIPFVTIESHRSQMSTATTSARSTMSSAVTSISCPMDTGTSVRSAN